MSTTLDAASGSVVLHNVPWKRYEALASELEEHHVRLTYNRGTLEIMSPSPKHERAGNIIGRLVIAMAEELGRDIAGFGSTTFKREDLQRGLEPDECYYIANESAVRSKDEIDLTIDPPPDLAVEVDVTGSSIDRQSIYAGIGVPELWRYANEKLVVLRLNDQSRYERCEQSLSFPEIRTAEIARFVALRGTTSDSKLVQLFREWVRTQKAGHV